MQALAFEYDGVFLLLCVAVALVATALLYFQHDGIPAGYRRWIPGLALLRFISVFLICLLLLGPLWRGLQQRIEKPVLLVARDASASVGEYLKSKDPGFTAQLTNLLDGLDGEFQVESYSFGQSVRKGIDGPSSDKATDMGSLFEEFNTRFAGRQLGGLIFLTDGLYNQGNNPIYPAGNLSIPIYSVGLGDTARQRDLAINRLFHNELVYSGDELEVQVDLVAHQLAGKSSRLSLFEVEGKRITRLKSVDFKVDREDYFQTLSLAIPASRPGTRQLRLQAEPLSGEASRMNNSRDFFITVLESRQKILLLAQAPHPDLAALRQSLETNANYEVVTSLLGEPLPDLASFDLLVMHQVPSPGRQITPLLQQVQQKGMALWWIVGESSDFRALNNLQPFISFTISENLVTEAEAVWNEGFQLFQWEEDWSRKISRFPPLQVPFGDVLSRASGQPILFQRIKNIATQYPVLTLGESQSVRSAVFVGDGLWRWRLADFQQNGNHEAFDGFVGKIIQYLSVKRDNRRFRIVGSKPLFDENEPVTLDAELYNSSYELINDPEVSISLKHEDGNAYNFQFGRVGKGYRLQAGSLPVGNYSCTARTRYEGKELTSTARFSVRPLQLEFARLTADHNLLRVISAESGGRFFHANALNDLAREIRSAASLKPVIVSERKSRTLLSMPLLLLLLLLSLTLEWGIRRYFGLMM